MDYPTPSLSQLCLNTVTNNLSRYTHEDFLQALPSRIKCDILRTATTNPLKPVGIVNEQSLQMLLNTEVESLNLKTSTINDLCLEDMQKCKKLRELVLPPLHGTGCTKETLCDLIPHLQHLVTFKVCAAPIVDDHVVKLLCEGCPQLKCLVLEGCPNVTDTAMEYITRKRLASLNVASTSISNKGLKLMMNSPLKDTLVTLDIRLCNATHAILPSLPWFTIKEILFQIPEDQTPLGKLKNQTQSFNSSLKPNWVRHHHFWKCEYTLD